MRIVGRAPRRGGTIRRLTAAAAAAVGLVLGATTGGLAGDCGSNRTMIIVAHEDDDIIFMNPDEARDIRRDRCVLVAFVTAGDAGGTHDYWGKREYGAQRAHESLAGVETAGSLDSSLKVRSHKIALRALGNAPNVILAFLRLPDGNIGGQGFERNGNQSLKKLWEGTIPNVSTVSDATIDGLATATTYTKTELTKTLLALMKQFRPDRLRIQNHEATDTGDAGIDHSDHINAAHFAAAAAAEYAQLKGKVFAKFVTGYRGYEVSRYKQNVFGSRLDATLASFGAYASVEGSVCANADCSSYQESTNDFWGYPRWIRRQYPLNLPTPLVGETEIHGIDGKCVDLENNSTATGNPVQIYSCGDVEAQKWLYDPAARTIKPKADETVCVRTRNYPPKNGAKIEVAPCDGSDSQSWRLAATGEFVNASGKCLEAPEGGADGADLVARNCSYAPEQLWGYDTPAIAIAPPHVFLSRSGDGLCLTAKASRYAADGAIAVQTCKGKDAQKWRFPIGSQMRAPDGRCVASATPGMANGEPIVTRACDRANPDAASASEGWVYSNPSLIHFGSPTNKCLQTPSDATSGSRVRIQDCAGSIPTQSWVKDPG